MNEFTLSKLGLSSKQYEIYKQLLVFGEASIFELSAELQIPRATVHHNVQRLLQIGLVGEVFKGKTRVIIPQDPEKITQLLENKKFKLEVSAKELDSLTPNVLQEVKELSIIKAQNNAGSKTLVLEGETAIANLYREMVRTKRVRSYPNAWWITEQMPYVPGIFAEAFEKYDLHCTDIYHNVKGAKATVKILKDKKSYQYKLFPKETICVGTDYCIFDGKIAVIYRETIPKAIVIQNKLLFDQSVERFDLIWELLPQSK